MDMEVDNRAKQKVANYLEGSARQWGFFKTLWLNGLQYFPPLANTVALYYRVLGDFGVPVNARLDSIEQGLKVGAEEGNNAISRAFGED